MNLLFIKSRKGISPIIAVILLLMMTIAIAGLAYSFIQRYQAGIQGATENTSQRAQQAMRVSLRIDGYNTTCGAASSWVLVRIQARNAGTEAAHNLQLYMGDAMINGSTNATLGAGVSTTYLLPNASCALWINQTKTIKLVSDEQTGQASFTFSCPFNQSC